MSKVMQPGAWPLPGQLPLANRLVGVALLVSGLEGHHGVEDGYCFPTFMRAEPPLRAFEVLDSDHALAHDGLDRFAQASAGSRRETAKLAPDQRRALDALERTFQAHLSRPLDGEEDIVIPLMIQLARKGEGAA
jgi:hypothetical protein